MIEWVSTLSYGAHGPTYTSSASFTTRATAGPGETIVGSTSVFADNYSTIEVGGDSTTASIGTSTFTSTLTFSGLTLRDLTAGTGSSTWAMGFNGSTSQVGPGSSNFQRSGTFQFGETYILPSSTTTTGETTALTSIMSTRSYTVPTTESVSTSTTHTNGGSTSTSSMVTQSSISSYSCPSSTTTTSQITMLTLTEYTAGPGPVDAVHVRDADSWEAFAVPGASWNGLAIASMFGTTTRITFAGQSRTSYGMGDTTAGTITVGVDVSEDERTITWWDLAGTTSYTGAFAQVYAPFPRTFTRSYRLTTGAESDTYSQDSAVYSTTTELEQGIVTTRLVPCYLSYRAAYWIAAYSTILDIAEYPSSSSTTRETIAFEVDLGGSYSDAGGSLSYVRNETMEIPPDGFPTWESPHGGARVFEQRRKFREMYFVATPTASLAAANLDGPTFIPPGLMRISHDDVYIVPRYPASVSTTIGASTWIWSFSSDTTFATSKSTSMDGTSAVLVSSTFSQSGAAPIDNEARTMVVQMSSTEDEPEPGVVSTVTPGATICLNPGIYDIITLAGTSSSSTQSLVTGPASLVGPSAALLYVRSHDNAFFGIGPIAEAPASSAENVTAYNFQR